MLLCFFFALMTCGACEPRVKTPSDTLVVGLEAAPLTRDPRLASDAASSKILHLTHNGLFRLNERLEAVPDLVSSFEPLPGLVFRFHLRPGVFFNDGYNGRELTADDVKYTLESISDSKLASPLKTTVEKVESIRVIDPLTLEIRLKEPFSPFLPSLNFGIVSKDGDPSVGNGPFAFEKKGEGVSGDVVLKRNEKYFGGPPKIETLIFKVVPDDNLRVLELKNGRIDLLQNGVPPILLDSLRREKGLDLERTAGTNFTYLGLNLSAGPLKKLEVRRAMAMAIDVPAIIEYRLANTARTATSLLAPVHWAHEGGLTTHPYDPKRARELLDQAGYPDPDGGGPVPRFSLTYKTSTKKDRMGLARLMARYLKEVGIEVQVLPFEWGTFFHDINQGNFQMYSLTWVGVAEPDIFYDVFHSSRRPPAGSNRGGYSNPVIDQLTVEGRKIQDRAQRKEIYAEVQKILAEDLPIIPLWYEDNVAVFSKRVKNLRLRPDASFEWATEVYKE